MKPQTILLYLIVFCGLSSCSYKIVTLTSTTGEKFKYRQYFDDEKQQRYENSIIYKRNHKEQSYQKFSGKIFSDTTKNSLFIQYDSTIRIYLEDSDRKYVSLYTSGLIYPKMIFCATDSLCKPLENYTDTIIADTSKDIIAKFGKPYMMKYKQSNSDTVSLDWDIHKVLPKNTCDIKYFYSIPRKKDQYGWQGNSIWLRYITELKYLEKSKHKRVFKFEIAVYPGGYLISNPTDYDYFIKLENNNSTKNDMFNNFIKNAKVSFFYLYRKAFEQ